MRRLTLALCLTALPAFAQQGQPGAHFVENWDLNEDGAVTVEEAAEKRGDVFLSFDANEDGYLDAEEYVAFDEARANDEEGQVGQGGGGKRPSEGMTLQANDLDGDGRVSRDEFVGHSADWIAEIDRNGDGVVTTDDFGPGKG